MKIACLKIPFFCSNEDYNAVVDAAELPMKAALAGEGADFGKLGLLLGLPIDSAFG